MFRAEPAGAQTAADNRWARFDAWASLSVAPAGSGGELVTSYSPPLLFDGEFTSHASQTLKVEPEASLGFSAGFDGFFARHAGVQVVFDQRSSDVGGSNTPYGYTLSYISRPPPNNLPQPVTVDSSRPWADTTGSLAQLTIAINAVARIGRSDRLHGTISGGPAFHRITGVVQPVAFTASRLGGHSVLFTDDFQLAMTADPKTVVGFDLGGDLDVVVGRHAAIAIGYRLYAGPDANVTMRPSTILNPDAVGVQLSLEEIAKSLPQAPLRLPMTSSRFSIGFKIIG